MLVTPGTWRCPEMATAGIRAGSGQNRVDGDDPFDGALLQQRRIFFNEVGAMTVADDEIEIAFLEQMVFDAGENQRGVAFADFRNNHADGEAALLPQESAP